MIPIKIQMSFRTLVVAMTLAMTNVAAQGYRPADTVPVLHYEQPLNFIRIGVSPENYSSTQYNASIQVYPFEPFTGNIVEMFQRTLLRERIDPQFREENVAAMPQLGSGQIPGAQAVFHANFTENIVGILRPHIRIVIVAGGAAAIVDASAINMSLLQRFAPEMNGWVHTIRVDAAAAPPSFSDGPGPAGRTIAGLYRGMKSKFMAGLTFQPNYSIPALHFYLFSTTGRVYRAYDQILPPGADLSRFDYDAAQRADPVNSGRYAIRDDKLYIKMGSEPMIVTALPAGNTMTVGSVTYVRQ